MVEQNYSYQNISEHLRNSLKTDLSLNKETVLNRMIDSIPQSPWANIEILDWQTNDDKLPIEYYFYDSPFGEVLVANTSKAVCYLGLVEGRPEVVLKDLEKRFKYTTLRKTKTSQHKQVLDFLDGKVDELLQFHLKGTTYQTEIWRKLIRIPFGKVISYATLGGSTKYARAAGTANGRNPIFYIVPCHRAVNVSGKFDRYFWGKEVKRRLLTWEFVNSAK